MTEHLPTNEERINAIERLGYTRSEAAFLATAALHGGYFVRRQFNAFIQRKRGWRAASLIERLIANRHAKPILHARNRAVYHICSKPFYAAIGEQDNRNRRDRQPFTIKNKLMALDYVFAHSAYRFLSTEREKCAYFAGQGILHNQLPARIYDSADKRSSTVRYFVDKFPLFLSEPSGASLVVSFSFIDEGLTTISRLESHLAQYAPLFKALGSFRFVYVAGSQRSFRHAEQAFGRFIDRLRGSAPAFEAERLIEHFCDRQLFEARQTREFNKARLDQLRSDLQTFQGATYQALYNRWKQDPTVLKSNQLVRTESARPVEAVFETYLLSHDYELFGTLLERAS
jgi:hypothetical protein